MTLEDYLQSFYSEEIVLARSFLFVLSIEKDDHKVTLLI